VWSPDGYERDEAQVAITSIAALGTPSVEIIPTWYQPNLTTSKIAPRGTESPTDADVRVGIQRVHDAGMKVILKPHVDLPDDHDRGDISPKDPTAWFTSYRSMMLGYARMATENGVEMLCVGTELASTMKFEAEWRALIAEIRTVYAGPLTYAANYTSVDDVRFWDALDHIGVDAYYELVDRPTTDVATLTTAWAPHLASLKTLSERIGRPVLITEVGYVSQRGATTEPWNWEFDGVRADDEQRAAYRAVFDAFGGQEWCSGIVWWMWDDLSDTGEDQRIDYTPNGKPAAEVLRVEWAP